MTTEASDNVRLMRLLRDSAGIRSAAYLSTMVGVLLGSYRLPRDISHPFTENIHPYAFPAVLLITERFARLRDEDKASWARRPTRKDMRDLALGLALGTAASTSVIGIAMACGWASAPQWGWESGHSPEEVIADAAWAAANIGLLVFNEEQIFRGYGLDALRAALGTWAGSAASIGLFARYHGPGMQRFLGLGAAGLFLTLLRLGTGNLWLAAGFHYAWNLMQKAVFGPPGGPISLRPLHIHGPAVWVGRPGHPDPGWIQIVATLVMAAIASLWLMRRQPAQR